MELFTNPGTYYVVNQAVVNRGNANKQYTSTYNISKNKPKQAIF
jgi:hypothetical protein